MLEFDVLVLHQISVHLLILMEKINSSLFNCPPTFHSGFNLWYRLYVCCIKCSGARAFMIVNRTGGQFSRAIKRLQSIEQWQSLNPRSK